MNKIVIHINAPDQKGIVSKYTNLLSSTNINIVNLEQHVEPDDLLFFMRISAEISDKNFNFLSFQESLNKIDKYCINHSTEESKALIEIREYTQKNENAPAMISGPLVVNFLKNVIQLSKSKSILEIGMFTGYSALGMAEVLSKNGEIHTCELCPIHINTAQKFFNKFKYNSRKSVIIRKNYNIVF